MTRILEFAALAAGALTLALPASAQDKPEALVTTTKGVYKSRSFALAADKGLRLDNGDETRTISLNELVSIQFQGAAAARSSAGSPTTQAVLANGDTIYGTVESESDSALRLRTVFGSVSIKLEHLRKVAVLTTRGGRWTRAPDLSRGDLIRLASGEEDVGMVERIGENDIGFRSSILKERLNYPVRDVSEIHFQPVGGRTTFEASRAFASVGLADGSSLRGNLRELSPSGVKLEAEIGSIGDPSFPISLVASITLHNGSLAYLSDIAPASALEKPYVGVGPMLFPYQRDRSVAGDDRPLSVAGTRYPKGLGVHAHSELTYALDGKFGTFQAIAGLDDSAGGKGSVVFKVIGDGKVLFDSGVIAGRAWAEGLGAGSAPKEIRLDVRGVQKLTLRVESGPDDDVQDRAAWADAKLIR